MTGAGSMTVATAEGAAPAAKRAQMHRASCSGRAKGSPIAPPPALTEKQARTTPEDNGRGQSADRTLGWDWKVDKQGRRTFRVFEWNGSVTRRCSTTDRRRRRHHDRAVRLGARHLPGDHRSAGLRPDLCQPDPRHARGASPGDGDPLVADRLGDPDVLRTCSAGRCCRRSGSASQLPHRRRDHAVLHRARHGVRKAHRAARKARPIDRGHAGGRGHQRLPDGDPDDRRAGIDRQRDAVGFARRNDRSTSRSSLPR